MRNITKFICVLFAAAILVSFASQKSTLEKSKTVQSENNVTSEKDKHASQALDKARLSVNSRRATEDDLRSAIYHLSEAALHSSPDVKSETSALLQIAVKKLQKEDPNYFDLDIYYRYTDNVEVFISDYNIDQPYVSAINSKGKREVYPYITKGNVDMSRISEKVLNAHVIELEIPGTKEKTRLYIDANDFQHAELPNRRGHNHRVTKPVN